MRRFYIILLALGMAKLLVAQAPFVQLPQNFTNIYLGAAVWADYDRDGYLDFYLTGWRSQGGSTSAPTSTLYRNNGNGTFTEISTNIVALGASFAAWADFDNDGFPDIAVAGNAGASNYDARIYRNNGDGTFTDIQAGLTPLLTPSLAWGDLNNDGRPDLVASGTAQDGTASTTIYYNNGNYNFTAQASGLPSLTQAALAIGDMNLDGLNDIVICGRLGTSNYISRLYVNNDDGSFSHVFDFEPARYAAIDITDVDGDGLPDVVIQGGNNTDVLHTSVYRNLGNNNYQLINNSLDGIYQGWAAFGDFNNDGFSDLAITGSTVPTGATRITKLYTNHGNGQFSEFTQASFPGLRRSMVQWADMNNDGKLDLLLIGYFNPSDYKTMVYVNQLTQANTPPTAPTGLQSMILDNNQVLLSWQPSDDAQTPQAALTYNLRVGTSPGAGDLWSAHALANGKLILPQRGNRGQNLNALLGNLPNGTYYWSVQAIDAGFMGSAFAEEQSFSVGSPTVHEVTFNFSFQGQPLAEVLLETSLGSVLSNQFGTATIALPQGNHPWFATKMPYRQAFGELVVSSPMQIDVDLFAAEPQTLPLNELFDSPGQPFNWFNISQNNNFIRWNFNGSYTVAGTAFAAGPPVHAILISPQMLTDNLNGNLKLNFTHRLTINQTGARARVYAIKDAQSLPNFELLAEYVTSSGGGGTYINTDITIPINASINSIAIGFELEETSYSAGIWEIDQVSLTYQPNAPHEVKVVAIRQAPNIQSPWFMQTGYVPAATLKNIGYEPIQNLRLEVFFDGQLVGESAPLSLGQGQSALFEVGSTFAAPAQAGTYAIHYSGAAPGIDLTGPNNQGTYLLMLTDSTYAQDYGTVVNQLHFEGGSTFGHVFAVNQFRLANLGISSIGVHWGTSQTEGTFTFGIYQLAPNSDTIETQLYQSPLLPLSSADAGHYRNYNLGSLLSIEFGTRYALLLHSDMPLQLMTDGTNIAGYHHKFGNHLTQIVSPVGAPILRMNVQLVGAIEKYKNEQLSVYPNPAGQTIRLHHIHGKEVALLFDARAKLLKRWVLSDDTALDVSHFSPGIYIISLPESGRSVTFMRLP